MALYQLHTRAPCHASGSMQCQRPAPAALHIRQHNCRSSTCRSVPVIQALSSNGAPASEAEQRENYTVVQRNLALELVRVTEAAALAGGRWLGKGNKNAADQAAVDQMRKVLNSVAMDGVVVIGEGEKDEAPMLYCGERIGCASEPQTDIAVDPLDGTTLVSQGRNGAIAVIAVAERGALFDPGPCMYMEKLAVGPSVNPRAVSLNRSTRSNIKAVAEAQGRGIGDVTVVILDRPRHEDIIRECRETGCRIKLISDGDVAAAIEVAKAGAAADIMMGIGGTPEGVIAAAALKCMGGHLQGRLHPRNDDERDRAVAAGYDLDTILHTNDLAKGDQIFFAATGVSDGDLLRGVRYFAGGATTNSIVMRHESGTVRVLETQHRWERPGKPFNCVTAMMSLRLTSQTAGITNLDEAHPDIEHRLHSGSTVGGRIVQ